ncbi:MAG: hypothetical protein FWD71_05785 [Oscillospiraceae bacterium]|nr:hypothetical protein [Oscillospiraceae bacterium]
MSKRIENLKKSIQASMLRPKTWLSETESVFEKFPGIEEKSLIIRNAEAVRIKFSTVPMCIWERQLIAGSIVIPANDDGESDIIISGSLPDYATAEEKKAASLQGLSVGYIVGHIVPSYPKLLKYGTSGIKKDAMERLEKAASESKAFYEAVAIVMDALEILAGRYSKYCRELSNKEIDPVRKHELSEMAADLAFAPKNPPETFTQAVTSIWLTHFAFQLTGNNLAIGRFDQHVWQYLKSDLENGRINMEKAQEIVTCFFLKFNERSIDNSIVYKNTNFEEENKRNEASWAKRSPFAHSTQRNNARDNVDATNHWLQNVIIGGVNPQDGKDASNPVTYMCLEAFDVNRMTNPCLTLRLFSGTPEELYTKACEVLVNGGGLPAFFNDEAIIPALTKWGISIEDARDYTNDGCWEIIIAGRNDFYFDRFNMLRCLEWTLNNGKSRMDGKKEAPDFGDPLSFTSYESVYNAFLRELEYEIDGLMEKNCRIFGTRAAIAPVPLLSALLDGPMENGFDMTHSGAKYITYGLIAEGVSHVIDSFAAIKKTLFEDGEITMEELLTALDNNFEGHDHLRQKLLSAPKYGRNQKEADEIGAHIINDFADKVAELNKKYDTMIFLPGAGTFSWYIAIGEGCAASPDGRKSGEPVSSNLSPSAGAATRGVTGAILSHASFDMTNLPVGSPNDLRIAGRLVANAGELTPEGRARLTGLLKSFVNLHGNMLTLSVADTSVLREAQKKPENYRDLRVRMGGWSAYFIMLSAEQQEHHIMKQEELS